MSEETTQNQPSQAAAVPVAAPPIERPDPNAWKAHLESLNEQFKARGWYKRPTGRLLLELLLHVSLALGGLAVFVVSDNLLVRALAILVSTVGCAGVSTNTHTSSHDATSDKEWVNRLLTYFGYPFFLGMSATYWWHKHLVVHHPTPNVIGVDDDANLSPWFALFKREIRAAHGIRRIYYRFQWIIMPLAITINGLDVEVVGTRYLLASLRDRAHRTPSHWIDLGALGLHWACWVFIPMAFFPVHSVLALYALRIALLGWASFIIFSPAHFPPEAESIEKPQEELDFIALQTCATLNFRTGFIGRLVVGGVDYQIEHHLFPAISHVYYPKLSPIVKDFCREHGYPFRTLGWAEAVWKALMVFRAPKNIDKKPRALWRRSRHLTGHLRPRKG